ncbi:hypothetical protein Tco_0624298 [Tanacetum coccineum]|uniref:Uncharacterized protein n=1 Tax=Tanacetum coccineum TaxID=301880 RepID=A0ABQ4WDI2_9ASTR
MGYLVRAYYNISPTRYYKDDPFWSADLKSKTTKDIINIRSFVEVLVLNQYADTEEPLSHTEGEHVAMKDDTKKPESDKAEEEPINAPESSQAPKRTDKGKKIATGDVESLMKLVPASKVVREDPNKPIRTEVIKIVQEEAEKIKIDPKKIISAKAGEKFKKAQDAELQVLKREHSQKVKRLMELNKKRDKQYMLTISNRLKPNPITDVKIHPNSKPAVLTVFKNNDKRKFQVHSPFKFFDFGVTKVDELGPIIQKKKNTIVKYLMTSLGKRYKRLKKIHEELGIQSALPTPIPEQALSQSSWRKKKHMELEPKIKVHGLECDRNLLKGVPFMNNIVIEEPKYGIFFTDVFGDQAF